MTTLTLQSYSFHLNKKITKSFHYFEDPIDATRTSWPNGGRINGFHCNLKQACW